MFSRRSLLFSAGAAFGSLIVGKFSFAGLRHKSCCACRCPHCDYQCKLEAKEGESERTIFEVESKVICIPRVVFPWQMAKVKKQCSECASCGGRGCTACVHNGARMRTICVAKPKKVTCPKCKYAWTAEKVCRNCCGGAAPTERAKQPTDAEKGKRAAKK